MIYDTHHKLETENMQRMCVAVSFRQKAHRFEGVLRL